MTVVPKIAQTFGRVPEGMSALVALSDMETRSVFADVLNDAGVEATVEDGNIRETIDYFSGGAVSPPVVIVDIQDSEDPLSDMDALADVCVPGTSVIAVGQQNDARLFRALVGMGVSDYLVKPVDREDAHQAVMRAAAPAEDPNHKDIAKLGKLVVIVGVRGGVGATSLATNAAWILSNRIDQKVALVDLDLYFGTTSFALDLEPGRGMRDALENPDRIDSLFIASLAMPVNDRLQVFASEEPLDSHVNIDSAALDLMISELRHDFRTVIIDLPRHMITDVSELLTMADTVILVSDLTLAGMRDTIRLLTGMKNAGRDSHVKVVADRVLNGKNGAISQAEFEKGIDQKIDLIVPEDTRHMNLAANAGQPISQTAKTSKAAAALRTLADEIAGVEPPKKKNAFFNLFAKK